MKAIRVLAGCAFAMCLALPALADTDFHVRVNLGNAPPPPRVYVQHAPRTEWLPQYQVSVVNDPDFDDDYFQAGGYWYVYRDNYWYRARSWRGPFVVIDERYVPRSIGMVPANHWRHSRWTGPYNAGYDNRYNRYDNRWDNGRHRGWRDRYGRWHDSYDNRGYDNRGGWRDRDGYWHDNR
jgi:hypothetical protein